MSLLGRMVNTFRGAWTGAVQGWSEYNLIPSEFSGWDTYLARAARYQYYTELYNNSAYSNVNAIAAVLKARYGLYQHIRGVRNPVARDVDLFTSKIYGGMIDWTNGKQGAIPLVADDDLRMAAILLWKASNWGENKDTYVSNGALFGDTCLKLVDTGEYVCMEVVHPGKVAQIKRDRKGHITRAILEYDVLEENNNNRTYRYREEITLDSFATFKDNKPFDYTYEGNSPQWDNQYGFVPLVMKPHKQTGLDFGMNAFHTSIRKIHEINDAASLLNDNIRKSVNIQWLMIGIDPPASNPTLQGTAGTKTDAGITTTNKDGVPIHYVPNENARAQPLIVDVNIEQALRNIESMEAEIERDLPELSLHGIRGNSGLSGVAIENVYSDAISKIVSAMGNYDSGLCLAQSMGIAMSAYHGYKGFERFSLEDYHNGNLEHSIAEREIFDHSLKATDKLQIYPTLKDQPPSIARRMMEVMREDEDTIKDILKDLEAYQDKELEAAARQFSKSLYGDDPNNPQQMPSGEDVKLSNPMKKPEMAKVGEDK